MDFVKKQWKMIVLGVAALGSLGMGYWAYTGGDEVVEKLTAVSSLVNEVEKYKRSAANKDTIKAKAEDIEVRNAEFAKSMDAALAMQKYNAFYEKIGPDGKIIPVPRDTLIPNVLPKPGSNADAIDFKSAYAREHAQLAERLRARDKATAQEIADQEKLVKALKTQPVVNDINNPWSGGGTSDLSGDAGESSERTFAEFLRDYAPARAAEDVARRINLYLSRGALGIHHMVRGDDAPKAEEIWHAQMSLWIEQDLVTAMARCNDARSSELMKAGRTDDLWVAHMPVKHLIALRIADRLGNGGGLNDAKEWPVSFTGLKNDEKMFIVPLQLELVVEAKSLNTVIDSICRVGFYTPIAVTYSAAESSALQDEYIYGEEPAIRAVITLEGYYIRSVFDKWIPDTLKPVLSTPGAGESNSAGRGGG